MTKWKIYSELETIKEKAESQAKALRELEFEQVTGQCYFCGGYASEGHLENCKYIEVLVNNGLIMLEESEKK